MHSEHVEQTAARLGGIALRTAWENLECDARKLRARDAAAKLLVSEGELIASFVGERALRLETKGIAIVSELPALGPVKAITRNDACVHEKTGYYEKISGEGAVGLVLGSAIDLRLFPNHWHHSFAVFEQTEWGLRRSLQFFDADGSAVHKVYQTQHSDSDAFDQLIARWRSADQSPRMTVQPTPTPPAILADSAIDTDGLRRDWAALQDTHDFFGLLRRYRADRLQALRLAGDSFARPVACTRVAATLQAARDSGCAIMVFVGNAGCIQIHTGPVHILKHTGQWINILDSDFCLHLREDAIAHAFIVRKPTRDGDVHSLELFDRDGVCFAQMFGARKPGQPERGDWRTLISA